MTKLLTEEITELGVLDSQAVEDGKHLAVEFVLGQTNAGISDDVDRLVRVTAINTANVMGDTSEDLIPLLSPRLESDDDFERIISAANLWRICRSEDAYVVLRREAARNGSPMAEMAAGYLEEAEA